MFTHRFFHVALAIAALAITSVIAWQALATVNLLPDRDSTFRTPQTSDYRPADRSFRTPQTSDYQPVDRSFHTPQTSDYRPVDRSFRTPQTSDYRP